jgi:transcription elongation factor Elf1
MTGYQHARPIYGNCSSCNDVTVLSPIVAHRSCRRILVCPNCRANHEQLVREAEEEARQRNLEARLVGLGFIVLGFLLLSFL